MTNMDRATAKIVLCRPRGGLNDMLCQMQHCFSYCRKHGRDFVLDTSESGLKDDFFRYFDFVSTSVNVQSWESYKAETDFDALSTYPARMSGRLDRYDAEFGDSGIYQDVETNTPLQFDFRTSYDEDILLYENCGGGINSYWLLKYLTPTAFLKNALEKRLNGLPKGYVGVHIRNTDLATDHQKLLGELAYVLADQDVLFCTDSGKLQADLRQGSGHSSRAIFLSDLAPESEAPLHASDDTTIDSNLDMMADLFALGQAAHVYFGFTKEGRVSGFSGLAYAVHCSSLKGKIRIKTGASNTQHRRKGQGLLRYIKAQFVIILAKGIYKVAIKTNEVWPNR